MRFNEFLEKIAHFEGFFKIIILQYIADVNIRSWKEICEAVMNSGRLNLITRMR